jgi:hypothetical protein
MYKPRFCGGVQLFSCTRRPKEGIIEEEKTMAAIPDYPRSATFEEFWASIMEDRENIREWKKESAREFRELRESLKETDRIVKETAEEMKKTERQMKKTDKRMGDLHNRFGELAEHLVAPGIAKRFNEIGYHFRSMATKGCKIMGADGKTKAEVDILLENGDTIMAVEVKTKPVVKDIEHHERRLEILRDHRRTMNEKPKKIQGAIAGAIFGTEEKKAVLEAGLFVLEQSGDTMKLEIPEGFVPREW